MLHLVGYYESVDQGAAALDIAAMADETLYAQGDDVRIPPEIANLAGAACLTAATTFTSAQVRTPSLRTLANLDVLPAVLADNFPSDPPLVWMGANPHALVGQETMTFQTNTDHASAVAIRGLVWLSDGASTPAQGEIFSVRCTSAVTLSAGSWVNGNLTFTQDLPAGNYAVVGLRAQGTNLVSARLVFPGGRWRPGVPAVTTAGDKDFLPLRFGASGVLGTFDNNTPPSIDCEGHTDSAQTYILDLIKVG